MVNIFTDKLDKCDNHYKAYKTERFCTLVDHNIIFSVETGSDGSENKTCQSINSCKKKRQCKHLQKHKSSELNYI